MSAHPFVDEALITAVSGRGGDGVVSFRREKFVPRGGPNGGDGGRGGDVVLIADRNLSTLLDLKRRRVIRASKGANGGNNDKKGPSGETVAIHVPVGTMVFAAAADVECDEPLVDLKQDGQRWVAARGGNGGHGNARFKTSTRRTPDFALPGQEAQTQELRLSLKLLADVGLVGFPNAGKSTLLRRLSAARPKVASYPFTTLTPSLGVVEFGDSRFVVADIPGLIEGASDGAGLGHRFLRHIERTRVIVHLLDLGAWIAENRNLLEDYQAIRQELRRYRPEMLERREIVVLHKIDLVPESERLESMGNQWAELGIQPIRVSGATGEGIPELVRAMHQAVEEAIENEQRASSDPGSGELEP
ncbi:MAG: GTPase ObgE [Myxococcota bacterium]|nr:GTPase ObgE [Myxococcota bacterium]